MSTINGNALRLYHTSPCPIQHIDSGIDRLFGSVFFFSDQPYSMSIGSVVTYSLNVSAGDVIDASALFYHERAAELDARIADFAKWAGCTTDDAESLIEHSARAHDIFEDSDDAQRASWEAQVVASQCAAILGFRVCAMPAEQGTCYVINMLGRDADLTRCDAGGAL